MNLLRRHRRKIPFVQQLHTTDCGAAALAMAMAFHGKIVPLDSVRHTMGATQNGVSAHAIVLAARIYGIRARGVKLGLSELKHLPIGSILHWEFRHFVVFAGQGRSGIRIVDPAGGPRTVSKEQFSKAFTGVAITCEPDDHFVADGESSGRIWDYLRQLSGQTYIFSRVIITSIMLRLFALAVPALTAMIVDKVIPRGDSHFLWVAVVGLLGIALFLFLSELTRGHLLLQLRTNLDTQMTIGFVRHLVMLPYGFFQQRQAGDLMMRVNSNATIREILTASTVTALLDGVLVFLYLGIIAFLSPAIAILALSFGVTQIILFLFTRKKIRDLMSLQLEARARNQSHLTQMLQGIETLKTSGAELRSLEHWSNLFVDEINTGLMRGRLDAWINSITSALRLAAPLTILGYGALEVMDGKMSLGTMLAVNAVAIAFLTPLASLVTAAFQLQLLGGYIERLDDVLQVSPEQPDRKKQAPRITGQVSLVDISFAYTPDSPVIIQSVSLRLQPGQSVAIVGKSGSGKSTLASLIAGLYRPTNGQILFDSHDMRSFDIQSIRRQMGIIPQSPHIFGSSLRENIALTTPEASLDEIITASKLACIHDDIASMPMSYDSVVADGGASISGGQRQRIALARALLRRPAILLLDEATSALDAVTESRVMNNLAKLKCTRIIVAHRLSTISFADMIIVMHKGTVAEQGSHAELMAQGGLYVELVAAQSATVVPGGAC